MTDGYLIRDTLCEIGIEPHMKGFEYSAQAVEMILESGIGAFVPVFKVIYPTIARRYDTSVAAVERSIRHSKGYVFRNGLREITREIFGGGMATPDDIPTNQAFLYGLAYYIDKKVDGKRR